MKYAPGSFRTIFYVLALLVILPAVVLAQKKDNQGKEFYVAFAENQGGQGFNGQGEDLNFFALFITSKVPTRGTVEVTALGFSKSFTTTPGTITTIELPDGKDVGDPTVELTYNNNQVGRVVSGMAVHITSDDEITVYGINEKQYSTDAFMALPIDVLGTEYRTLNYPTSLPNGGGGSSGNTPGEFWVVGVADSTNITITPKANTRNGISGGTLIKQLIYRGDVFLVQGDPDDNTNDLTGSLIEADQPVAVFSGHVRTEMPQGYKNKDLGGPSTSRDHLVEQLPPVSAWGDSALIVRYSSASLPDVVRIVSSEDDNIVRINGIVVATLKAGGFYEIKQLTAPVSIQATSPILVGQYLHTSVYGTQGTEPAYGDPAYSLVFPVEQFDTNYTFMLAEDNDAFTGNFINIVADPGGIASMMLDGKSITAPPFNASFFPIPGSNYQYTQIQLAQGAHNIYSNKSFGITVYALGNVNSYSYPGGSLLKTITPFKTVDLVIDFGDRVMTTELTPPPLYISENNFWDTTVYLQNISSDPYEIKGFATRTGNDTNFLITKPLPPRTIGPGVRDSMTIRFRTTEPNIRMHTKINAVTEHLRAYVVDVYGRGILQNAQIFTDSTAKTHIDTLDFGVLDAAVDPPKDSFVYVFNKGEKDLVISGSAITGINAPAFSILSTTIKSVPTVIPYILHPYNLLAVQDSGAKVSLEFKPGGLANGYYEAELDVNTQGQLPRKVILIARIKTILKSGVLNAAFDTAFLCQEQSRSIFVDNPNDFPITVTNLTLAGANPGDFIPATAIPLVVAPASRGEIKMNYAPTVIGKSTATAIVSLDLPKGFADTLVLTAFGDQLTSKFWARDNIHILPGEETIFPIYAKLPMQRFASPSFVLRISYDGSHLEDVDYIQENTLTAAGAYTVNYDSAGYREYFYHTLDNSIVSGGSDTEVRALVYIKFKSHLNEGEDPLVFHKGIDINYKITFDGSFIPDGCIATLAPMGRITLDSSCETISLLNDTMLYPVESYIEPVRPNPVYDGRAKFIFDVPQEDMVSLGLFDAMGNKAADVLTERRKPGTYKIEYNTDALQAGMYYLRLQTAGQTRFRKLVIVK